MKNKLLKNIFSSGLQAIAIQFLGVFFFAFLSFYLSKEDFGIINATNAKAMFLVTLLSLGLEQVVIRRVSSSKSSDWAASAYLFHAIGSSLISALVLYVLSLTIDGWEEGYVLLCFFAAQSLVYIGTPLKQFLNAKERFTPYGIIAFVSNICKLLAAWILLRGHTLDISAVVWILIGCSIFEFVALLVYTLLKTSFTFKFKFKAYIKLIKEARGQFVAVIFDSGLSRMDWILLGILSTNAITGDYSFAYRAFELAKLPVVILAPVMLPRFSRLFIKSDTIEGERRAQLESLLTIEVFLAVIIPLLLNIVWSPWVGALFDGKYGPSNAFEFGILSVCIPLHFVINLFWTISFAAKKYRAVSAITITSSFCNFVLNIVLIKYYGGAGAAIAFLVTTVVQTTLYYRVVGKTIVKISAWPIFIFSSIGLVAYLLSRYLVEGIILQLFIATLVYTLLALILKQIKKEHVTMLYTLFAK